MHACVVILLGMLLTTFPLQAFNENPKTFITRLQELRLLPTPTATPRSVAAFLRETRGLDLVKVGEYLAQNKEWNKQVSQLERYVCLVVAVSLL